MYLKDVSKDDSDATLGVGGERGTRIHNSALKFVYRCANGRFARRHVGTRRELSRIDVIIISRSIATRDEKLRSIIRSFPGTVDEVPLSYSASTRERDCDVHVHNAYVPVKWAREC